MLIQAYFDQSQDTVTIRLDHDGCDVVKKALRSAKHGGKAFIGEPGGTWLIIEVVRPALDEKHVDET